MTRIITVGLVLLGLTLFYCSGQDQASGAEPEWFGTWEGTFEDAVKESAPDDAITTTLKLVRLRINPDGTFSLLRGGMPATGDFRLSGDKVILKVKRILDRPVEDHGKGAVKMNKEITVEMQKDGTALLIDEFYDDPIVLTKRSQR